MALADDLTTIAKMKDFARATFERHASGEIKEDKPGFKAISGYGSGFNVIQPRLEAMQAIEAFVDCVKAEKLLGAPAATPSV